MNYITAPDTVIYSAVIASSAIPLILQPIELIMKDERGHLVPYRAAGRRWRDGSLITDIPERTLHQLFNVNVGPCCGVVAFTKLSDVFLQ